MSNTLKEYLKTAMHALRTANQLAPCPLYADGLVAIQNAINMEAQISKDALKSAKVVHTYQDETEAVPDEIIDGPQLVPTIGF